MNSARLAMRRVMSCSTFVTASRSGMPVREAWAGRQRSCQTSSPVSLRTQRTAVPSAVTPRAFTGPQAWPTSTGPCTPGLADAEGADAEGADVEGGSVVFALTTTVAVGGRGAGPADGTVRIGDGGAVRWVTGANVGRRVAGAGGGAGEAAGLGRCAGEAAGATGATLTGGTTIGGPSRGSAAWTAGRAA
jgi:hypothetical protein